MACVKTRPIRMSKQRLLSGHEVEFLSGEDLGKVSEGLTMFKSGFVRILPDGWLYPGITARYLDQIYSIELQPNDVFLITFPKSGTTWMQEILWIMANNPEVDPNNEEMKEKLWVRSMDLSIDMLFDNSGVPESSKDSLREKFSRLCPGKKEEDGMSIQLAEVLPSPRVMKSHYPLELLNKDLLKKCKVVYVARNPKDMMVSFYHYARVVRSGNYQESFEKFARAVMKGEFVYCPYWPHVLQAWRQRDNPNLYFTTYDDMKDDIMAVLRQLNKFLGKNLTEEQLKKIAEFTSFSSMKTRGEPIDMAFYNQDVWNKDGGMFRKGVKGDWKNYFTPELNQEIEQWIRANVKGTGLDVKWGYH